MRLPAHIDSLIRSRFEGLVKECEALKREAEEETQRARPHEIPVGLMRDKVILTGTSFDTVKTKFLSLLQLLSSGSGYINTFIDDVRNLANTPAGVNSLIGKIQGLKDDYENGMLINFSRSRFLRRWV